MRSVLLLFTLFLCVACAAQSHRHLCDDDLVPEEVRAAIEQQFPGWHFQRLSDLSDEYQQQWLKQHPEECPGFAEGHYQSSAKTAWAMILLRTKAANSGSKLVVLSEVPHKGWQAKVLKEETTSYYYEAVSRVPPGKYSGKAGAVHLALDGFQVETFDVATALYYWRNGKFQTLTVR
jgi:hypothetical protein